SSSAWAVLGEWLTWDCNRNGYCSPYCYCDSTVTKAIPMCNCLVGFEPTSMAEGDSGRVHSAPVLYRSGFFTPAQKYSGVVSPI
ncbi:hypothetical protein E2562_028188, partial [Oryza meyeriana var. granulata]